MEHYGSSTYGDRIAGVYDDWYEGFFDTDAAVEFLHGLSGGGPALELGVGTGRIALPLSQQGVEMQGIDASSAMVDVLRAKRGGDAVIVHMGDFAEVPVEGLFRLAFVVFNTFFGLLTQEAQVSCFRNVASHLMDGGTFVLECFVPDVTRFTNHQRVGVERIRENEVLLDTSRHDPVNQRVQSMHTVIAGGGNHLYPVHIRYAWPSELDLMAQLAGLRLRERWAGWRGERFDSSSASHVSVYEKLTA